MNYRQLQTELQKGITANAYLFISGDRYIASSYVRMIRSMFLKGEFASMNSSVFEDKKVDEKILETELYALPMMSDKRVVVIYQDASRTVFSGQNLSRTVISFIENPNEQCILIMLTDKADARTKLYNAFSTKGKIVDFARFSRNEVTDYVDRTFEKAKLSPSKEARDYLIGAVDYNARESTADLGYFVNEIDKIAAFCRGKKNVTLEDVKTVVSQNIVRDIYRYTDDVLAGNSYAAFEDMNRLKLTRVPLPIIMSSLDSVLRQNAQWKTDSAQGLTNEKIASKRKANAYVVKKTLSASKMSIDASLEGIAYLAGVDMKLKTGLTDEDTALVMITSFLSSLPARHGTKY